MVKIDVHLNVVSIKTHGAKSNDGDINDEFNDFVDKLGDKALSLQSREGYKTRIGVILWNHSRIMAKDDFIISLITDRPGVMPVRGLVNLQRLALNYPGIRISKMGAFESARKFYRDAVKDERGYKKINDLPRSARDFDLKIALIFYKDNDEYKEVFEDFIKRAGGGRMVINSIEVKSGEPHKMIIEENESVLDGYFHDKEVGLIGFNRGKGKPIINVILVRHNNIAPIRDNYWVIIMAKNNPAFGTEINESSLKRISATTGVPLLEWGKFKLNISGDRGIRREIDKEHKKLIKAFYNNIGVTIEYLINIKENKKSVVMDELFNKVVDSFKTLNIDVPEVFKDEEFLKINLLKIIKDYEDFSKEELDEEIERIGELFKNF